MLAGAPDHCPSSPPGTAAQLLARFKAARAIFIRQAKAAQQRALLLNLRLLLEYGCAGEVPKQGETIIPGQDDGRRRESLRYLAEEVPDRGRLQLSLEQVPISGP
jgi:hypothetical protein